MGAGNSIIGSLRAVLGIDTAQFETGLKSASSQVSGFGAVAAKGMAGAAAAVAAAGAAIGFAMKRSIDDFDQLAKTSQKIGVPVEQLSSLAYAADLSDVSFEALSKSVGKLSKAMVEAAAKPTSEAANAFKALGVSVTDSSGKLKSSDTVLADIAGKFEGLKDGAGKTAVAMALFGKTGADLIPLLNGGRDSLKEMADEAAIFGAVISTKSAKEAENFNDNITRLGYAVKGVFAQSVSQVLPTLVEVSNRMVDTAKNSGILQVAINVVSNSMKGLVTGGVIVGAVFRSLAEYISTVSNALSMVLKGEFTAAMAAVKGGVSGVAENATVAFGTIDKLWRGTAAGADAAATATTTATKAQKDFNYAALGGKNAFDQFIAAQQKSLIAQQAEFAANGLAAGAKERLKIVNQGLAVAQQNGIALTEAQRVKLTETAAAAELMALKLGNLSLLGGESNPFIAIGVALDATNAKLAAGGLSAENYAILSGQAAQLTSKLWQDSATSLGGSFESIGSSLSQMGEGWARFAKAGQAIGAAIAFVNAYVAASEALAKATFPANIAIAAGVLAKGIAMVAAIKGAAVPAGHEMGGAFRVPGGSGGGDRVPFNAMLEPGELVEITSNRPDGYRPGSSGSGKTIIMQGMVWGQDQIRDLVAALNDGDRNGIKLEFAS